MVKMILSLLVMFVIAVPQSFAQTVEVMTLPKWKALSADDRQYYIEGYELEKFSNLKMIEGTGKDLMASLAMNKEALAFAQKMDEYMQENVSFEIEDSNSSYGETTIEWLQILMMDGQVLGGTIGYLQRGCDLEKDNYQYFSTQEEAEAAGCDTGADVSWQAHGVFDQDLQPLRYDSYMEWSGY